MPGRLKRYGRTSLILLSAGSLMALAGFGPAFAQSEPFQYPSAAQSDALARQLFHIRAVDSYIWGVPALTLAGMADGAKRLGVASRQMFIFDETVRPNQHLLTPNADIIYGFAYYDLRDGPLVVELPPGTFVGSVLDAWDRAIEDVGKTGPDGGRGGRYLVLPPQFAGPAPTGDFTVLKSSTNTGLLFLRSIYQTASERGKAVDQLKRVRLSMPGQQTFHLPFLVGSRDYDGLAPVGAAAFDRLARIVADEPAEQRDSVALGQLASIGIRRDKNFTPSAQERQWLDEAARLGRRIAANMSYNPVGPGAVPIFPGTYWIKASAMDRNDQQDGAATQIDQRAQLYTLGFGSSSVFLKPVAGKGAAYAVTFRSADGSYLDGGKDYTIKIPPNAPTLSYWSVTAYDGDRFDLIASPSGRPNIASIAEPRRAADGSYILRLGPNVSDPNAIQTVPGRGYFLMFRIFAPTANYLNGAWRLPDVSIVKAD